MISKFFTTTFSVERMEWIGDSSGLVSHGTFKGHIQQASERYVEHLNEDLGHVFTIWCDEATDVAEGDTLTIASGNYAGTYTVKNTMIQAPAGVNKHLELVVIKQIT